jgi:7-carboxy-7-deazaguanine synthase (Cx14CxxC type)
MTYSVKEIYYTLQGEGANSGRSSVLCRFAGCNLWSGQEEDRKTAACQFCDTDFVGTGGPGGGKFDTAQKLTTAITDTWLARVREDQSRFVVCTGGEPLLQLDDGLIEALHSAGFEVAVETNGTLPAPTVLDWVCVSPKAGANLVVKSGNELKLVYPQKDISPKDFERLDFSYFFLQPMDGPSRDENTRLAMQYCLEHPKWRLSLQTHKLLGIP